MIAKDADLWENGNRISYQIVRPTLCNLPNLRQDWSSEDRRGWSWKLWSSVCRCDSNSSQSGNTSNRDARRRNWAERSDVDCRHFLVARLHDPRISFVCHKRLFRVTEVRLHVEQEFSSIFHICQFKTQDVWPWRCRDLPGLSAR